MKDRDSRATFIQNGYSECGAYVWNVCARLMKDTNTLADREEE